MKRMKRIKKFESFGHRAPEEVSLDEFNKKAEIHGHEPFTQKEIDFLNGIEEIYQLSFWPKVESCSVEFISKMYHIIHIQISKLKDDWYLIYEDRNLHHEHDRYYICDEWDEVIGYLETRTNLLLT